MMANQVPLTTDEQIQLAKIRRLLWSVKRRIVHDPGAFTEAQEEVLLRLVRDVEAISGQGEYADALALERKGLA